MSSRSIHFRMPPPESAPDVAPPPENRGNYTNADTPEPPPIEQFRNSRGNYTNPLDAIGSIGRDITILHSLSCELIADREGRHGHLCAMLGAARRIGLNVQALIEVEER